MRNTFTRKELALAVACTLAFGLLSPAAIAQVGPDEHAIVMDSNGAPVTTGFGLCLRSGFGPAPSWNTKCHGELPAPMALGVAPEAMAAPAPAPVVMAAAAPLPLYEKVVFDANVLFDSDKSALRPAGRDTLDQFVARIHGLEAQSIVAIGYADRMGSDAANQTLSQQRVDTVKDYLVGKGIASDRMQASARGETRPTTSSGECKDANNAKNVACMQPDRHVFIEVSGTRIAK
jgi:OmpA-OmpF porin, OOP family